MYREPTVEWMKPRIKSMIWNIGRKKHSIRRTKGKIIEKDEDRVRSLWDNFKGTNI